MEIVNTMRDLLHLNPLYGEQFRTLLSLSEWLQGCLEWVTAFFTAKE